MSRECPNGGGARSGGFGGGAGSDQECYKVRVIHHTWATSRLILHSAVRSDTSRVTAPKAGMEAATSAVVVASVVATVVATLSNRATPAVATAISRVTAFRVRSATTVSSALTILSSHQIANIIYQAAKSATSPEIAQARHLLSALATAASSLATFRLLAQTRRTLMTLRPSSCIAKIDSSLH